MCLPGTAETVRTRAAAVSRRTFLGAAATGAAALTALPAAPAAARRIPARRSADLTHVFREGFPVYAFDPPQRDTLVTVEDDGFYAQRWTFPEHAGTHVDAPGHFVAGGRRAPELRPAELVVPAVVVDISRRAARDPDTVVTVDDLVAFERRHGRIPRGAAVLMYSGWEERAADPDAFKNADASGTYHFPGFGLEAARWLLENRRISCIGVDTLSLDHGPSTTFDVHLEVLEADRYGIENLANLKSIPARGATIVVGLVPWERGSGGPCRVLALW